MKRFKNTFFGILLFLVAAVLLLYVFDYEYILKGISTTYLSGHTTAYIEDYTEFPNREIEAGEPQEWPLHHGYNSVSATGRLQQTNKELGT
ncbi:hypothetical protein, partial [Longispora fulva]|uniref:hypothetical protein n=1 Tax=Longispora fulva TaxID=619741 RepID=UPI003635CEA9